MPNLDLQLTHNTNMFGVFSGCPQSVTISLNE